MAGAKRADPTADPRVQRGAGRSEDGARVVLDVVFHSDLSRIGDRLVLGSAADAGLASAVTIGRDEPRFVGPGGAHPLDDPCVSRDQLALRFMARLCCFAVETSAGARRPVRACEISGRPLGPAPLDVPPGALIAIGDRILLRPALVPSGPDPEIPELVGGSAAMQALRTRIAAVAKLDTTALVTGETGSGKELVARALHAQSDRSDGPYVALNCATLPETLAESELFGHVRGAFSGATADRPGAFEAARGGTLLLDEIGELAPAVQAKLLRVLQERAVRRVGTTREVPVDVRVVCATHRDLAQEVVAGRFRRDLFSRVDALRIDVPSLAERPEDVPVLYATFLRRQIDRDGQHALRRLARAADDRPPPLPMDFFLGLVGATWPHNVRDLENLAAAAAALNLHDGEFMPPPLPASSAHGPTAAEPGPPDAATLVRLLEEHDYVQEHVARSLGVARATLGRWMRQHGLRRPRDLETHEIRAALDECEGDVGRAADLLRVSERGLALRVGELGLRAR